MLTRVFYWRNKLHRYMVHYVVILDHQRCENKLIYVEIYVNVNRLQNNRVNEQCNKLPVIVSHVNLSQFFLKNKNKRDFACYYDVSIFCFLFKNMSFPVGAYEYIQKK